MQNWSEEIFLLNWTLVIGYTPLSADIKVHWSKTLFYMQEMFSAIIYHLEKIFLHVWLRIIKLKQKQAHRALKKQYAHE